MRYIVTLSSGKDSEATLWWAYNNLPFNDWDVVFNETDWDDEAVYEHLAYLESRIGKKFIVIKNNGWADKIEAKTLEAIHKIFGKRNIFAEMVIKFTRFPSTKKRICTQKLKVEPQIDWIIENINCDTTIIQGVRSEESKARSMLREKDDYFKFYYEPFATDSKGNPKYHTYRKKEVYDLCDKYEINVLRPILKLNANEVFNIIFENNSPGNALYKDGFSRVGCYPCVMCKLSEIRLIAVRSPKRIDQIYQLEQLSGSTFFPPGFIPERFCSKLAKCEVYREDLLRLFGNKITKPIKDQSQMFPTVISLNPEERLYKMYFQNDKIPVYLNDDGEEYIIRTVKVPTVKDVVKYVLANPDQVDLIPRSGGCVSVYNICESPAKAS